MRQMRHDKRLLAKIILWKKQSASCKAASILLLCQSFKEWLELLNYSVHSIPSLFYHVRDFLLYQERHKKLSLQQLVAADATDFINNLQTLIGMRTKRPFSNGSINKYIQALHLFSKYIRDTGKSDTGFIIGRREQSRAKPCWLTKSEIQRLYEATGDTVLGIRDRAMLAVYYGCGLRLNEGINLHTGDIGHDKKILHVRKGKYYKERYVPIAEKNYEELKLYIEYARPQLLQEIKTTSLFIDANKGRAMHKQSLYVRIKRLIKIAKIKKEGRYTYVTSFYRHAPITIRNEAGTHKRFFRT